MEKEIGWLLQEKYGGEITSPAKKDIARLKSGEPLDYLIGFVRFLDCVIDLSQKPLIPRVETEFWTDRFIASVSSASSAFGDFRSFGNRRTRVLDMFAGSGCVGVAVLKHVPGAEVTFADSEENCVKQITINAKRNNISAKRYRIVKSDVFSGVTGAFDYILANPPYIPLENKSRVQKSALEFEPTAALFGGADGLAFAARLLASARRHLNPGGQIWMEFDSPQKPAIQKLAKKFGYRSCQFHKDQYGRWRYVVVQ